MNMMPPFAPDLASDAELAVVYDWLGGIDSVRTPTPITVTVKRSSDVQAGGQAEFEMTAQRAETALRSEIPDLASLHYRLTLITNGKAPVANQRLEYGVESRGWVVFTTNQRGEALLDPDWGASRTNAQKKEEIRTRLRMAMPSVRTVLVVEALDVTEAAKPVIVGIGTAILTGRQGMTNR